MTKLFIRAGLTVLVLAFNVVAALPAASSTICTSVLPQGAYDNIIVPVSKSCTLVDTGNNSLRVTGTILALQASSLTVVGVEVGGNVIGDKAWSVEIIVSNVRGDISIKEGGSAYISDTMAGGNITVEKMLSFVWLVEPFTPNGNVIVTQNRLEGRQVATGPNGALVNVRALLVSNGNIGKNLQVVENTYVGPPLYFPGPAIVVESVQVHGSLQVFKNNGDADGVGVVGNSYAQSIQCKENAEPFFGGPNYVIEGGRVEGQCFGGPF